MHFDPSVFGQGFHRFVKLEYQLFGAWLAPLLHVVSLVIILLALWRGNRVRTLFTAYFTLNWLFLFGYWGVFAVVYWAKIGIAYLFGYIAAPILLALITFNWIRELYAKRIDIDFSNISKKRWIVLPIIVWGFLYPAYLYGQGFSFSASDLLFSYYGLMPCPTTMVVLSLFTLTFPRGNRTIYHLMTVYAIVIGTATVMTGWLPDIPFILLGLYALCLILYYRSRDRLDRSRSPKPKQG